MKTVRRLLTITLSLLFLTGYGCFAVFADGEDVSTDGYNEDYQSSYTVSVYSGKEGNFGSGVTEKSVSDVPYGASLKIDLDDGIYVNGSKVLDFNYSLDSGSIYYARGLKLSGHDNDETSRMGYRSFTTTVTEDLSYSVAYAMKGSMVKYRINYVDESGNTLLPSEEYYGMAGDYPVVSYKYIEGYAPDAYNLGQTLSDNESENVFTFTYSESNLTEAEQAAAAATRTGGGGAAGAGTGAGAGAGDGAGAGGQNINNNPTPRAGTPNVKNLDDPKVPKTNNPTPEKSGELSLQKLIAIILGGACTVALIAALALALARSKNADDDDEEDDADAEIMVKDDFGDYTGSAKHLKEAHQNQQQQQE